MSITDAFIYSETPVDPPLCSLIYVRSAPIMGTRVPPPCPLPIFSCDGPTMAGLPQLIDDLQRLSEDQDNADVVFICGREEERIFAHRIILMTRFVLYCHIIALPSRSIHIVII